MKQATVSRSRKTGAFRRIANALGVTALLIVWPALFDTAYLLFHGIILGTIVFVLAVAAIVTPIMFAARFFGTRQ